MRSWRYCVNPAVISIAPLTAILVMTAGGVRDRRHEGRSRDLRRAILCAGRRSTTHWFAALAKREGVSPSYFTRLVRLSYLAPDITQAILDGRQPRDLTADKLLARSRLPLTWHEQRTVLGFA